MKRKQFEMTTSEFRRYLDIYGSDLQRWPQDVRDAAKILLDGSAELQKLVGEEELFEHKLELRNYEEPSPELQDRIIASAKTEASSRSRSIAGYLSDLFSTFYLPSPAFSLALILVIGIMIGYFTSSVNAISGDELISDSQFALYEGEIYEFED